MKNLKENIRSLDIISLLSAAAALIVGLFTIVFDNKRINTENTILMILLVSLATTVLTGYILLIIRRINPKQYIYISYTRADKD